MTTPDRPDDRADPERDAWLREALRHAPDAQAAPPATVSDAILRQARAAAHAAPAAARGRWSQAWAWLARPPVAAGFASVMVATVVGLMWWDRPIDPRQAPMPTASPAQAPRDTAPASAAEAPLRSAPPAAPKKPAPAKPIPQPPPEPLPAAPEAFPSNAPTPQADGTAVARDDAGAPPAALSRRGSAAESRDNRAAAGKAATDAGSEPVTRPAPWATALASINAEPQRWYWQRNGLAQPMSPPLQRWLAQFDAATVGRWRRTDEIAPAPAGRVLRLYRDGAPAATLRFDVDHAWFTPETHAVALPAASVERLLKELDAATP